MNSIKLDDLDMLDVGHKIQLYGAIYSDGETVYLLPLPDEDQVELTNALSCCGKRLERSKLLNMDSAQWEKFLRQTDVLDIQGPAKAILRKSQRQVDQAIAWKVFRRDGFKCRYCGQERPLTVDHVVLWEEGGLTVEENLISACRRCNKLRGNMQYEAWLTSEEYIRVAKTLSPDMDWVNQGVVFKLEKLQALKTAKQRSR